MLAISKPKVILCEKPLSYTFEESEYIVDECAKHSVPLFVNFFRRAHPPILYLKSLITTNEITPVGNSVIYYSKGLLNSGLHFLDMMSFLFGPVENITRLSSLDKLSSSEESRDFNVHLNVLFAGINSYFVPLVGAPYFHNSVEIFFPEGRFFYDRGGSSVSLQRAIPDQRFAGYIQLDSPIPLNSDFDRLQWNVCDALASFLAGMNTTLCSGKSSMIIQKQVLSSI